MFGLLSYLRLWGVASVEIRGGSWIVDAWPEFYLDAGKPRKPKHIRMDAVLAFPCQLPAQSDCWLLFQRLLELTKGMFFEVGEFDALRGTHVSDFAKQRNDLHYRTNWWPHDDLYSHTNPTAIQLERDVPLDEVLEDHLDDRYTVALAIAIQRAALRMISDLGSVATELGGHAERLTWAHDQVWTSPASYARP